MVKLAVAVNIEEIVRKHYSDYYHMAFMTRTHLNSILFGILCDPFEKEYILHGYRGYTKALPEESDFISIRLTHPQI